MKFSKKIAMLSICLTPLVLLTACVPPTSYLITASSSDTSLGFVQGYNRNAMPEGEKVTLVANATSESPFACWVKDDYKVVSNENSLKLTYTASNEGHYTAVFEEKDFSKMAYCTISEFDFSPSGFIHVEYSLKLAKLKNSSGSSDFYEFMSGRYDTNGKITYKPETVLYFGGAGDNYVYLIKLNLTLFSSSGSNSIEYQMNTRVGIDSFDSDGNLLIKENIEEVATDISITIKKLNAEMFEVPKIEQ